VAAGGFEPGKSSTQSIAYTKAEAEVEPVSDSTGSLSVITFVDETVQPVQTVALSIEPGLQLNTDDSLTFSSLLSSSSSTTSSTTTTIVTSTTSTTTLSSTTHTSSTPCICPSTTTPSSPIYTALSSSTKSSWPSTTSTTGWTRADGSCDCVGLQITDSSSQPSTTTLFGTPEEETSTALPMTSNSGRRLRRELLEMERKQSKTGFESKLFKNLAFLRFN